MTINKKKIIDEFAEVINKNSLESMSNTPDFVLAEYLWYCLESFSWASNRRETWYNHNKEIIQPPKNENKLELTDKQKEYLSAIEWLVDEFSSLKNRATGRSFLLAYCFIQKAIKNPGVEVFIWDHGPYNPRDMINMERLIKSLREQYFNEYDLRINVALHSIRMEKSNARNQDFNSK
jgi:hypothetical protein